jgi:hypothetical protein
VAFETRDHGVGVAERLASELAPDFGWDDAEARRAFAEYIREVERIFHIDSQ